MLLIRRTAMLVAFLVAVTGPALSADAGHRHWKTMITVVGGKVMACKVKTTAHGPWKIKLAVDARRADDTVSGSASVLKNEKKTKRRSWDSGVVKPHHRSEVGTVRLPRGKKYRVRIDLAAASAGAGGVYKAKQIRRC